MLLDMEDFKNKVIKLAKDPESVSAKVEGHPDMDSLHVNAFGYELEDRGLVEEADTVFDLTIRDFSTLLDQLPN